MDRKSLFVALIVLVMLSTSCAPASTPTPAAPQPEPTQASFEPTKPPEPTQVPPEPTAVPEKNFVVGMVTITSHPSLDQIAQGVKDSLAKAGFVDGENLKIIEGNAQGDMATMNTIVQGFIDEKVDLIVAITTPAAQTAYNLTKDAGGPPVIYSGISNPYAAGLAEAPDNHPAWIYGNQLMDPIVPTLELVKEVVPEVKKIGMVYNPAEANSAYLVEVATAEAEKMGLELVTAAVSNSNEISTAAESLVSQDVDAFMSINDNTVVSGFEAWVKVANDNQIPLLGTSASMPGLGAVASYGVNPYQEGLDSGDYVAQVLNGELDLATAVIQTQDAVLLTVNPAAAEKQGVTLPQSIVDKADKVIE
jgi:putative tryptophan/tyrosine transport system substrate-binding protein